MITLYQKHKGPPEPRRFEDCNPCFDNNGCKDWKLGCAECCGNGVPIDAGIYIMVIIAIIVGSILTIKYKRK